MRARAALIIPNAIACIVAAAYFLSLKGCVGSAGDRHRALVNASGGSLDEVVAALHKGADINGRSRTIFGWTPLISAIYHRKADVAQFLLASGANPNLGDSHGETALCWAV